MQRTQYGVHPPPAEDNIYEYASPDICMQHTTAQLLQPMFLSEINTVCFNEQAKLAACPSVSVSTLSQSAAVILSAKAIFPKGMNLLMINDNMKFLDCIHISRRLLSDFVSWNEARSSPHHLKMACFKIIITLNLLFLSY